MTSIGTCQLDPQ